MAEFLFIYFSNQWQFSLHFLDKTYMHQMKVFVLK